MDILLAKIILCFLTGGFLIFLAIVVTRDNFANRLNRVTGAMLFFAGTGPLVIAMGIIVSLSGTGEKFEETTLYHLQYVWEFFFPLFLLFSWIFPVDRLKNFKHYRVRYLIFLPQLTHLALDLSFEKLSNAVDFLKAQASEEGFSAIVLAPLAKVSSLALILASLIRTYQTTVFGLVHILYLFAALYFLESGRSLVTNPRLLTQTRTVVWGTRLGAGLFTLSFLGATLFPHRLPKEGMVALFLASLLIWAIFLTIATIRHQFLNVRLVFRYSFIFTLSSAALVAAFVVAIIKSKEILTPMFGEQANVIRYAFIVLLLLLFQPVYSAVDNALRAMFIRTRTDHRNVLERFSRQVISLFDPEKLRRIIEETLKTTLLVERVYFILFDDSINEYAILPGEDNPRRIVLDREDFMLRGINQLDTPTYLHTLSDYKENSTLATFLEERQVRLLLPLKDAEHLLGCIALTNKLAGYRYSSDDFNLLGVLSNQIVTALTNARLYVESLERMRLQEEVSMARQIQLDLLPSAPPQSERFVIAAHSTPSRTVGGDFYDFIPIDEHRIAVVIADASGKGMPAALMIAQIQAIIRSEVNNGNEISTILQNINRQILHASSSEKYATLFYGELDLQSGVFRYSNAGHNYPVLLRATGEMELLKEGGPIIGALPDMAYQSCDIRLEPHDLLFLYTDGLSEAMDGNGNEYGEERIYQLLMRHKTKDPHTIVELILQDVRSYDPTDPPRDDTTIIAIKMNEEKISP